VHVSRKNLNRSVAETCHVTAPGPCLGTTPSYACTTRGVPGGSSREEGIIGQHTAIPTARPEHTASSPPGPLAPTRSLCTAGLSSCGSAWCPQPEMTARLPQAGGSDRQRGESDPVPRSRVRPRGQGRTRCDPGEDSVGVVTVHARTCGVRVVVGRDAVGHGSAGCQGSLGVWQMRSPPNPHQ
jgi:hypothetical protein